MVHAARALGQGETEGKGPANAWSTPVTANGPAQSHRHPERSEMITWTTSRCVSTGCSEEDPTANKHPMRRLTRSNTNQNCCRNQNPTTDRPHAGRPTPDRPGVQGSKLERRLAGGRHHGTPHPATTMTRATKAHRNPTIRQLTNQGQRTTSNPGPPGRAQARPSQEA